MFLKIFFILDCSKSLSCLSVRPLIYKTKTRAANKTKIKTKTGLARPRPRPKPTRPRLRPVFVGLRPILSQDRGLRPRHWCWRHRAACDKYSFAWKKNPIGLKYRTIAASNFITNYSAATGLNGRLSSHPSASELRILCPWHMPSHNAVVQKALKGFTPAPHQSAMEEVSWESDNNWGGGHRQNDYLNEKQAELHFS